MNTDLQDNCVKRKALSAMPCIPAIDAGIYQSVPNPSPMPLSVVDYLGAAHYLSTIEHGAYVLILMASWRSVDFSLPDDDKFLAKIAGLPIRKWMVIRFSLEHLFVVSNGFWKSKYLQQVKADQDRRFYADRSRREQKRFRISPSIREKVLERDGYSCSYCGAKPSWLEIDHIQPISQGGKNDVSNLCASCAPCNRAKGDKVLSDWRSFDGC